MRDPPGARIAPCRDRPGSSQRRAPLISSSPTARSAGRASTRTGWPRQPTQDVIGATSSPTASGWTLGLPAPRSSGSRAPASGAGWAGNGRSGRRMTPACTGPAACSPPADGSGAVVDLFEPVEDQVEAELERAHVLVRTVGEVLLGVLPQVRVLL